MQKDILEQLGLSKNEALVYNTLLSEGELQPPEIAKKTGLTRTNTYALLKSLVKKGLIGEFKKKNKLHYRLEPPQKLKEYIESQKKNLEQNEKTLEAVLPSLTSEYNLTSNKPGVVYFEGVEGLKKVFEDIYGPGKTEVYGCADINIIDKTFEDTLKTLIPKRIKNKILAKSILVKSPYSESLKTKDKEQLRKTILVDGKKYPLPAEIDIYNNKIAMLDFSCGKFVGIIIENKAMAETLRNIFKLAFQEK